MKQISRLLSLAAVAALCFSACSPEELKNDNVDVKKYVTVHFGTENTDPTSTKATLTPNEEETAFQAKWENEDKIAIKYTYVDDGYSNTVPGTWDKSSSKFTAEIEDFTSEGEVLKMNYQASYPYSEDGYVDFGSARTQTGAAYNSVYDLMVAEPVTVTAKPGLDKDGNAIVFPMQRQTAIAYFHFTSNNTEAITKATLKVEGEGAAIAAETVLMDPTGMDYETGLSEIVLTTTGQTADDFTLWFNVLPTTYTKMTLTVETATKTFTISNTKGGSYTAGKLYKVSKAIADEKWESLYGVKYHLVTDSSTLKDGDKITFVNQDNSIVPASTIESNYFKAVAGVTFNSDKTLAFMPESDYLLVTIKSNTGGWLFENTDGKYLKLTNSKTGLQFAEDGTTWAISIKDNDATISGTYSSTSSELQWNTTANPKRFTNYASTTNLSAVYIYVEDDPRTALETPENLSISDKTLTWKAVTNAKEYKVTIGSEVATVSETSYTLSSEADYYNVSVIAVAESGSSFKNSAAATLTDAKFGTPTLATPTLKEGAVDEFSVNATWTEDTRATAGYNCELYNGEIKIGDSKTVKSGSVTFDGLDDGVTYTIKVNAIAVEGTKAYAASSVATIDLTTKGTTKISEISATGTYTVKNAIVYAIPNSYTAIISDGTGMMLLNDDSKHGFSVGAQLLTIAGTVEVTNGIYQFKNPSSTKASEDLVTPDYGEPVEASAEYLASKPNKIVYVHLKGSQSGRNISVGSGTSIQKLYLNTTYSSTDNKEIEAYGFIYGYNESFSTTNFIATSITEDPTAPKLSVTPTSKTWANDATNAEVFTVTTNTEGVKDWTTTENNLGWATVVVDKEHGTITVTPNGPNAEKTANEGTITVTHAADNSLTETITLTQKAVSSGTKVDKTAIITFGTNNVKISSANVTAKDDCNNSWTITTVGTTSFTANKTYYQVGSKSEAATSITFTTTLPSDAEVGSIEAKFGGFSGTAGTVSLKVGDTSVGSGSLNGTTDVTVSSNTTAAGNVVTVSITGISKGVKCYYIKVGYKSAE